VSIRGRIEEAKVSQSGKTLGVKIGGTWYQTKSFELQGKIGTTIEGQVSADEWPKGSGKMMHWLNDYNEAPVSADDVMQRAMQGPASSAPVNAPQAAPGRPTDKDLTITALALVKCIEGITTPEQAVQTFRVVKNLLEVPQPKEAPAGVPFDDDISGIPF